MKSCAKYADWISAYVDNELSESETKELMEHLQTCPSCQKLLALYQEMDTLAGESAKEPPAALLSQVMEKVSAQSAPPAKKTSKPRAKTALSLCAAMAACFAVVYFAVPGMLSMGGSDNSNNMAYDTAATENSTSSPSELEDSFTTDSAASTDEAADSTDDAAPQDMINPSGNSEEQNGNGVYEQADSKVFYISGQLPAVLEEYEQVEAGNGTYYLYIDEETANALEQTGYTPVPAEEEDTAAKEESAYLVIYTP